MAAGEAASSAANSDGHSVLVVHRLAVPNPKDRPPVRVVVLTPALREGADLEIVSNRR